MGVCIPSHRLGIHAGPVMGAVVGTINRRFCLFGDTVNVSDSERADVSELVSE